MGRMRAERVSDRVSFRGEGPVWWDRWQQLRFVDMFAGDVLTLDGDRVHRTPVGSPIAAVIRPRLGGGAIVAREHDLAISSRDDLSDLRAFVPVDATACCFGGDDLGILYITTTREGLPADAEPEAGSLYAAHPGVRGLPVSGFAG